jgi:hypothetical protein
MAATIIRLWIIQSIRRILAGETFTREDFEAQPLNGWEEIESKSRIIRSDQDPAHFAWMALQWWVNDDDIRAKDPDYGEMRKRQLQG